MKPYSFFKLWILGFVGLLIFDLFIEGVVFEWLKLNGTTKNDWFFKVWWVAVVIWFLYGLNSLLKNLKYRFSIFISCQYIRHVIRERLNLF